MRASTLLPITNISLFQTLTSLRDCRHLFIHPLFVVLFFFLTAELFPQVQQDWLTRTDSVTSSNIVVDKTGNVYVAGSIFRGTSGPNICLIKYDSNGSQLWLKEFNGIGDETDSPSAIALDTSGNIFITGYSFRGPTLLNYEIVTIKYTPDGDSLWVRRYNSPNARDDRAFAIAVDSSGNSYVGGYINNISLGNVYGQDYITIKYSPEGIQLWAAILDLNEACINALAADTSGNVYVTGLGVGSTTTSIDYITVKYNSNGNIVWESRFNGPGAEVDIGKDIVLDDSGYVYVTGSSQASGWYDFITIKYDGIGEAVWTKRYDGPVNEDDKAIGLVVDKQQNVYVTGEASIITGSYVRDFVTIKYNQDGDTSWVRYYNGPGNSVDIPEDITIDSIGNIYITGGSIGTGFSGYPDYAVIRYNPNGDLTWEKRYNAAELDDRPEAITVDLSGNVYVTGNSQDSSYESGSVTIKYSQTSAATFQLTVNVANGWNMVSIPAMHPVNQNVTTWWAGKDAGAAVFKFLGGYEPVTTAEPGTGYWMKHTGANIYNTGDEWPAGGFNIVPHTPVAGAAGWNLFGGYEEIIPTASITTTPPGLISGLIYKYLGGYEPASALEPGYGYWVKLTGAGSINISSGTAGPINTGAHSKVISGTEDFGKVLITGNAQKCYTLYAVRGEVDLNKYELPPLPPQGMFDVRFSSQRYAERLSSTPQEIEMTGVEYPINIKAEETGIILSDETGKELARLEAGEEVTISSPVKIFVTENIIPTVYSLEQNYPNPFNPSTTIQFSIPEDVQNVKLIIYSALGEKVEELVNTGLQAGVYKYNWNASDVSSGLYIYQIATEKFVTTKKMMLLK